MRSRMWPRDALKVWLEAVKVPREPVNRSIHIRLREREVDPSLAVHPRRWGEAVHRREGSKGIITADVMRDRVGDRDILETSGGDLVIVIRITPRP